MPTALITGSSKGIGCCLAEVFAWNGYDLVLVARNESLLKKRKAELEKFNVKIIIFPCDLSRNHAAEKVHKFTESRKIQVDALVNDAGFGESCFFSDSKHSIEMIELNVSTLAKLTLLYLPGMLKRGTGEILNVASIAAFLPGPKMSVYYASKAFVLSFSEALHYEVRDQGVTVSCLCPGATRTDFFKVAGVKDSVYLKAAGMDPEKVAEIAFRGLKRKEGHNPRILQ